MNVPESLSTTGLKPTWAELIDQITWCSLTEICHNLESNQSLRILTNSLMKCVHNGCRTKWFRFPCLIPPSRFIFTTMLTVQQTQRCKMWAEGHSSARSSCAIIPAPSHLFLHKNSQNARNIRSTLLSCPVASRERRRHYEPTGYSDELVEPVSHRNSQITHIKESLVQSCCIRRLHDRRALFTAAVHVWKRLSTLPRQVNWVRCSAEGNKVLLWFRGRSNVTSEKHIRHSVWQTALF